MKKLTYTILLLGAALISTALPAQGLKVGDEAIGFNLKNIDKEMVSLEDYSNEKGLIVVFTCNHCPYAKKYEERIIGLDKAFKPKGYPVIAINPNTKTVDSDDFSNMKKRAKEKGYSFPYLADDSQEIAKAYGATRTPHTYVLQNVGGKFKVAYIGAIDDNTSDADKVEEAYVSNAVNALLNGEPVSPDFTKAIGCTIKWKK